MLRIALLLAWLTSAILCLTFSVTAQDSRSTPAARASAAGNQPAAASRPPALLELAQNRAGNLVDQLKMLRGKVDDDRHRSSRRTGQQRSAGPAAPATPAPPVSKPDGASGEPATGERRSPRDLPSVLVPGSRSSGEAPTAERRDMGAGEGDAEEGQASAATPPLESSRRTARRQRSPEETFSQRPPSSEPRETIAQRVTSNEETSNEETSDEETSNEDSTLSLSQQGPTLRVEAVGPKAISVGKPASYRIRLINQNDAIAREVAVTVDIPAAARIEAAQSERGRVSQAADDGGGRRGLTWILDQIPANSQEDLEIDLEATENRSLDLKVDWTYRPAPLSARIDVQQPQLEISIDGPSDMRFGETDVFKVRLSNPGNGPAEGVTVNVTTTNSEEQLKRIGTLAAGESRAVDLEVSAKEAGRVRIDAVARADGSLHAKAGRDIQVRQAVLAIEVVAPELIYAGTTAAYKIKVANRGDAVAKDVIMQLDLPSGATNGIGVDKKPITRKQPRWRVGDLGPDVERVYSMQCELNANGGNQLVAGVQGAHDSQASDTVETTVEAIADLKLMVNDPKGPIRVGQDAVYEIEVLNRGSKEATNVVLVAQFSEGVEPASVSGHPAEIVPGQVIFEPLESVPAGEKVTMQITARAAQGGNLRFRAELTCEMSETKLVAEESTRFYGDPPSSPVSRSADQSSNEPTPARR
ncbi:MAG: CARDB domain-containing protein [Planctomycetota bacterium]